MADYDIAAVTRRAVYTGSAGTGPYAFSFACLATSDIAVYKDTTLLSETSDYTVTLSASTGTGSITLAVAANSGNTITLVGARDLARTTDFVTAGSLTASALNTDFDSLVIFAQQLSEENSRNLKAPVTEGISGTTDMTIPPKATRASKILEFDSDGNPAVSLTATGLSTLAGITGNITTVAGISANVTTVAGISANVTTVAGISSNVTSVAAKASLITSDFVSDLNTLATSAIITDLDILGTADVVADLAILATSDVVSDLNTLATSDIVSDINTLATSDIVSDLNTLATSDIVSDINTLATSDIVSDLNTLATSDIVSDINTLATSDIVTDLNLLATSDFVSDLNTIATSTNVTNIGTVATNISGVNSFAARYRITSGDPGSDNDAGDLNFNTSSNVLKFYNGSAWVEIDSSPSLVTIADESTDTTCFPLFATAATGDIQPKSGSNLTFNSNTGILTATGFAGDITGNVTGNTSGSSGSCTGNAAGLSSTLVVGSGGTGATSLTANGVLIGNGTSAVTAVDLSTKGKLLAGDGSGNPSALTVGTNDYVLTADSSEATGLKWALAAAGATGGGTDQVFYENARVMTTNYTITSSKSASTVGPLTINSGVTLTIPSGERLVIL